MYLEVLRDAKAVARNVHNWGNPLAIIRVALTMFDTLNVARANELTVLVLCDLMPFVLFERICFFKLGSLIRIFVIGSIL